MDEECRRNADVLRHIYKMRVYEDWAQATKDNEVEFKGFPFAVCDDDGVWVDAEPEHTLFAPSANLLTAWQVVERVCEMAPKGYMRKFEVHGFPQAVRTESGRYNVAFIDFDTSPLLRLPKSWSDYGKTLPEAIRNAALLTVGINVTAAPINGEVNR